MRTECKIKAWEGYEADEKAKKAYAARRRAEEIAPHLQEQPGVPAQQDEQTSASRRDRHRGGNWPWRLRRRGDQDEQGCAAELFKRVNIKVAMVRVRFCGLHKCVCVLYIHVQAEKLRTQYIYHIYIYIWLCPLYTSVFLHLGVIKRP